MTVVRYAGAVQELVGTSWDVPPAVIKAGQAGAWVESQARQQQAEQAAAAEAERRQQELLAARMEQQRQTAAAALTEPLPTRSELQDELRSELDQLSQAVISSAAAIAGRGEAEAAARADWETRHEELVAGAEATLTTCQEQVTAAQAATQASTEQVQSELSAFRQTFDGLEGELRQTVSTLIGPQGERGEQGLAGSGVGYVDADPTSIDQQSLGQRFFGRAIVPGDLLFQRTPTSLLVWRTADGRAWTQIDEILNRQELVSQPISVLDQSTKSFPQFITAGSGGGSGGGGEPLLANRAVSGADFLIADTSNWAGVSDPTSGQFVLEILGLNGALSARRGFTVVDFTWEPRGAQESQAGLLGDLSDTFVINFSYVRGAASVPSGITTSIPAGTNALRIFANITTKPGVVGAVDTTSFRVSGDIEFAHQSLARAVPTNSSQGLQPLWRWI